MTVIGNHPSGAARRTPLIGGAALPLTVTGLENCGNSPRMAITAEILTAWATGDSATLTTWFADDVVHSIVGPTANPVTAQPLTTFSSPEPVAHLEVHGLLSHGKEAACDGTATLTDGQLVDFAHHFTFASAGKQAKVRSIRTFQIVRSGQQVN